jgi:hypothetical protein
MPQLSTYRVARREPGALVLADPDGVDRRRRVGDSVTRDVEVGEAARDRDEPHHAPVWVGHPEALFIVIRAGGHGGADGRANEVLEEVARRLAELDVLCARGEGFVSLEVDGVGIGCVVWELSRHAALAVHADRELGDAHGHRRQSLGRAIRKAHGRRRPGREQQRALPRAGVVALRAAERRRRLRDRFQVHEGRARVGDAQHHVGRVRDLLHRRLNGALRADEACGLDVESQAMGCVDGEDVPARRVRKRRAVLRVPEDGHRHIGEPEPVRADDAPRDSGYRNDVDGARRDAGLHERLGLEQERERVVERGRDGGSERAARRAHEHAARITAVDRAGVAVVHDIRAGQAAAAAAFASVAPLPADSALSSGAWTSGGSAMASLAGATLSPRTSGSTQTAGALRGRAALPCASLRGAAGAATAEARPRAAHPALSRRLRCRLPRPRRRAASPRASS